MRQSSSVSIINLILLPFCYVRKLNQPLYLQVVLLLVNGSQSGSANYQGGYFNLIIMLKKKNCFYPSILETVCI